MPKISNTGEPSYAGHEGVVTNAVGEQFEVDPTRELDGERKDGYTNEPVTELDNETSAPDVQHTDDRDNDQRPRLADHRQSEARQSEDDEKRTAAKKTAPAATKK